MPIPNEIETSGRAIIGGQLASIINGNQSNQNSQMDLARLIATGLLAMNQEQDVNEPGSLADIGGGLRMFVPGRTIKADKSGAFAQGALSSAIQQGKENSAISAERAAEDRKFRNQLRLEEVKQAGADRRSIMRKGNKIKFEDLTPEQQGIVVGIGNRLGGFRKGDKDTIAGFVSEGVPVENIIDIMAEGDAELQDKIQQERNQRDEEAANFGTNNQFGIIEKAGSLLEELFGPK